MPVSRDRQPQIDLSVVICTHNPDTPRLKRVLGALARQSLGGSKWELVVVDNRSSPPVSSWLSFEGPLEGISQLVVQPELGLTPARLAGIQATTAPLIAFVDDDNLLEPDYLETALRLFEAESRVGVVGGIIDGEFEARPPAWAGPYVNLLGVRNFGNRPMRALVHDMVGPWEPIGAGMVIRRTIAERYRDIAEDPVRRSLDRVGSALGSCGDTDMARCATDLNYYMAYEPSLRLTHVIPAARLGFGHLMRLCRSLKRSGILLDRIRTGSPTQIKSPFGTCSRLLLEAVRRIGYPPRRWLLEMATVFGELEARSVQLDVTHDL